MIIILIILVLIIASLIYVNYKEKSKLKQANNDIDKYSDYAQSKKIAMDSYKEKLKLLGELYYASDTLLQISNENLLCDEVIKTLKEIVHPKFIILYLFDSEKRVLKFYDSYPKNVDFEKEIPYKESVIKNISTPDQLSFVLKSENNERLLGFIKICNKQIMNNDTLMNAQFSQTDIDILTVYLNQIIMVLDRIKTDEMIKRMALTDGLTKLYNRPYSYLRMKEEVKRADRELYPISILFMDIDNFKRINDTYGHDNGDLILIRVANLLKKKAREYDVAVRWGGEEFIMILPNTSSEHAYIVAERIREEIKNNNEPPCGITISIGISAYPKDDDRSIENVINCADKALYYSKNTGKNKVTIYENIKGI